MRIARVIHGTRGTNDADRAVVKRDHQCTSTNKSWKHTTRKCSRYWTGVTKHGYRSSENAAIMKDSKSFKHMSDYMDQAQQDLNWPREQ